MDNNPNVGTTPTDQIVVNNTGALPSGKKKFKFDFKNKKHIAGLAGGIVLAGAAGYFGYMTFMVNSAKIYDEAVDKLFGNVTTNVELLEANMISDTSKLNKFTYDGDFEFTTNIDELADFDGASLKYSGGFDSSENMMVLDANFNNELDLLLASIDGNMYLDSTDIYDEMLLVQGEETLNLEIPEFEVDFNDVYTSIDSVKKSIQDNLKDFEIETEKETIEVDGKDVDATAHVMKLDGKDLEKLFKNVSEDLTDDDKFLEAISNLTGMSESDIKENIDFSKDAADFGETELEFIIYTSGLLKSFSGYDISINDQDLLTYRTKDGKGSLTSPILGDVFEMIINKESIEINYNADGTSIDIELAKKGKTEFTIDGKLASGSDNISFDGKLSNDISDDKIESSYEFNAEINYEGESYEFGVKGSNNADFNGKLDSVDTKDAVNINDLTSDELSEIENNFTENTFIGSLWEDYSDAIDDAINGNTDDGYDYDDYDTDSGEYTTESLFTTNANVILSAKMYADLNYLDEDYTCYTVEFLVDNGYITGLPSTYRGVVYTDSSYTNHIELEDTDTGLKVISDTYVLESEIDEDAEISYACPAGTSPEN